MLPTTPPLCNTLSSLQKKLKTEILKRKTAQRVKAARNMKAEKSLKAKEKIQAKQKEEAAMKAEVE